MTTITRLSERDSEKVADAVAALEGARMALLQVSQWGDDVDVRLLQTRIDFCVETIGNVYLFAYALSKRNTNGAS